jgi:hypothetical protein
MQSILRVYCHYEFVTHTVMLHFLTETWIACCCNSVGIQKPQIYDLESENTKYALRMMDVACVHICVLTRSAIFHLDCNECYGL